MKRVLICSILVTILLSAFCRAAETTRHPIPLQHPDLLGSLEELRALSKSRPTEYQRMVRVARSETSEDHAFVISAALVSAIENDRELAQKVQQRVMKFVNGPIRTGHTPFGSDLALAGIAYDLCYSAWADADRAKFHEYLNKTVDANVQNETHVFHNAWYGYKNWGIGVASYACYHENPKAQSHLKVLEQDYRLRAAPALELAGDGGGWAEGYYIHYWLYEWLFFCEVARHAEGFDYYALAPKFYRNRAIASIFEMYPGLGQYNTRRPVPMGDGGGRLYGGDRDKALSARRILVNFFRNDPAHQVVQAFNETTPRSGGGNNAYKDFLWRNTSVPSGNLKNFRLSHVSPGPGFVFARSSWDEDATYFFFHCGDRFTAHQHLDVGHFVIYKYSELAGDGGHYDEFGTLHDVNYHLRTIAHSTMLILDPQERWPGIRAGKVSSNDGGQYYPWKHHNGAMSDVADWEKQKKDCDIADLLAFEDYGDWLYVAGDATRAYSPAKLDNFTRQIVYLRPNTFIIFDRVKSKNPAFKKTWLLQAMKKPEKAGEPYIITNGKGRLFVQPLLPAQSQIRFASGDELYSYGGNSYPPKRKIGAAPECRMEISPAQPQTGDLFLNVLTAASAETATVPTAQVTQNGNKVKVTVGDTSAEFLTDTVGGQITIKGQTSPLPQRVIPPEK